MKAWAHEAIYTTVTGILNKLPTGTLLAVMRFLIRDIGRYPRHIGLRHRKGTVSTAPGEFSAQQSIFIYPVG